MWESKSLDGSQPDAKAREAARPGGDGHCVDVRNGQITVGEQVFRHFRKRSAVRLAGVLKVFTEQRAVLQDGHACRLR